jgi:hypothetical protein
MRPWRTRIISYSCCALLMNTGVGTSCAAAAAASRDVLRWL